MAAGCDGRLLHVVLSLPARGSPVAPTASRGGGVIPRGRCRAMPGWLKRRSAIFQEFRKGCCGLVGERAFSLVTAGVQAAFPLCAWC